MSRFLSTRSFALSAAAAALTPAVATAELLISQIYEGETGTNKFIELFNSGATEIDLSQYYLGLFSNANRENWKTGGPPTALQQYQLPAEMLGTGEAFLLKNSMSSVPGYAVTSANASANTVANFNGDDSVVLYLGNSWTTDSIRDAFSVSGEAQAENASFYRVSHDPGFNLDSGTSSVIDFSSVWVSTTVAEVANAAPTDPWYLSFKPSAFPPTLDVFTLSGDQETTASPIVALTITASGGPPTEFRVSESAAFIGATWQAYTPSPPPRIELSAGLGPKTVYLQLRNAHGESAVSNDTINRLDYTYAPTVLITQYYEGTSNNKYIELSNLTDSTVALDNWVLARWSNAAAEGWKSSGPGAASIALTGLSLNAHGTLVIAHNLAGSPAIDPPPVLLTAELSFNGDDSISLHNDASIDPVTLVDVVSIVSTGDPTGAGAGKDVSFTRVSTAQGFAFAFGSIITDFPAVWQQVATGDVDAATSDQNIFLGTYPGMAIPAGYDTWAAAYVGIGPRTSDDEGDGLTNIAEYATGGNPSVPNVPYSVTLNVSGKPRLVVPKGAIAAADPKLTYAAEASSTLGDGSWSSTDTTTTDSPTEFIIEYTGVATTAFLRLNLELQP